MRFRLTAGALGAALALAQACAPAEGPGDIRSRQAPTASPTRAATAPPEQSLTITGSPTPPPTASPRGELTVDVVPAPVPTPIFEVGPA